MQIVRSDVNKIRETDRLNLLQRFGINEQAILAKGTEAEVYEIDSSKVLKIYAGENQFGRQHKLKSFYDSIDESETGIAIPRIFEIATQGFLVGTIESRIPGVTLESLIPKADQTKIQELYVQAVDTIKFIILRNSPSQYLLFDETALCTTHNQSWNEFYSKLLLDKMKNVLPLISSCVPDFELKTRELIECISKDHNRSIGIVHGDLFPGNIMVSPDLSQVNGIIDFGSFTLFGDHLLDLASAFSFYRMYDEQRSKIRAEMLPKFLSCLGNNEQAPFFRYLLANAILTSDLYVTESDPRNNGHFVWAVEILTQGITGAKQSYQLSEIIVKNE